MDLEDVDVVLISQVRPDPTNDARSGLPEESTCSDDLSSRMLQVFKEMDEEFYSNLRDVPDYFEGLDEDAMKHGLRVENVRNPIQPPSRRVFGAIGLDDLLMFTSMWVIWLLNDKDKEAIRSWLRSNAKSIWSRLVSGDDPDAWRVRYADADGPIDQDYSHTLAVVASLPNNRLVRLLIKDECSLEEFRVTLSLFLGYVEHRWERNEDSDASRSVTCLALGGNGQLVEVESVVRTRRRRRRIEPTV